MTDSPTIKLVCDTCHTQRAKVRVNINGKPTVLCRNCFADLQSQQLASLAVPPESAHEQEPLQQLPRQSSPSNSSPLSRRHTEKAKRDSRERGSAIFSASDDPVALLRNDERLGSDLVAKRCVSDVSAQSVLLRLIDPV